jgi:hypothetical protein
MFAWAGQVTQGKLVVSVPFSPACASAESRGMCARSLSRNPGMERKTTCAVMGRPRRTEFIPFDAGEFQTELK